MVLYNAMDVSQIIAKSRIQTNTSTAQKTDQQMLADLNIVQDNIFSELWTKQKKYAWTYWNTDLVENQEEYRLPKENLVENYPQLQRLLKVYIDYWHWYKKATITNEKQGYFGYSVDKPSAMQADWSLFVFPAPKQAILGGLRVEWTYRPLPLLLADKSEDIKLPPDKHDILLCWLNKMNYEDKQLWNEAQLRENKYIIKMRELLAQWAMDYNDWSIEEDTTSVLDEYK